MIGVIDYGSGNINAIATIYKRLDIPFKTICRPDDLIGISKLVLPGVGDFDETMTLLESTNLKDNLDHFVVNNEIPIIGFCVGMQIMANKSEEGKKSGFGWIDGVVKKIDTSTFQQPPYLPHMGWNTVSYEENHPLFDNVVSEDGFYFLHSYYFDCNNDSDIVATTKYGHSFATVINRDNIYGIQFHPEKSHDNGVEIFRNFAKL